MLPEDALVAELGTRFGSRIVVLYGSHARGNASAGSDIDLVCFCAPPARHPASFVWRDLLVDAWLHPLSDIERVEEFRKLHDGRVLQDEQGLGRKLLGLVSASLKAPRPSLDPKTEQHLRAWVWKMFDRAGQPGVRGDHRRHWLLHELPEIWSDLSARHFLGPDLALDAMRQHSLESYAAFELAARADASMVSLERIVMLIAGPRRDA